MDIGDPTLIDWMNREHKHLTKPPNAFVRKAMLLIGLELNIEDRLERAAQAHLMAHTRVEETKGRFLHAQLEQQQAVERYGSSKIAAHKGAAGRLEKKRDVLLDTIELFTKAKKAHDDALATCDRAKELQDHCYRDLVRADEGDDEVAREILQDAYEEWLEAAEDGTDGWWPEDNE